ncbi:MAG: YqeG family HAD IIIA-type phosphatase [Oscillospiraceae bacterium]|jgi:HAD superfamily phosphatase (TIGR01668 family)|nr:YqeG family HAD IIIA-type phosphatase [Oscillospiraceae bacterium]
MHIALPKYSFVSVFDITADELRRMGVRAVAFDLDNTTVYDSSFRALKGVGAWVNAIKQAGFPMMILTNTYPLRAKYYARRFGVDYLADSHKPAPEGFFEAARRMGVDISEMAMIGDQLFKDIEGANRAGAVSVRVRPFMVEKLLYPYYRGIRIREKALFAKYQYDW